MRMKTGWLSGIVVMVALGLAFAGTSFGADDVQGNRRAQFRDHRGRMGTGSSSAIERGTQS